MARRNNVVNGVCSAFFITLAFFLSFCCPGLLRSFGGATIIIIFTCCPVCRCCLTGSVGRRRTRVDGAAPSICKGKQGTAVVLVLANCFFNVCQHCCPFFYGRNLFCSFLRCGAHSSRSGSAYALAGVVRQQATVCQVASTLRARNICRFSFLCYHFCFSSAS